MAEVHKSKFYKTVICCLLAFCLIAGWESAGVTYHDLNSGGADTYNSFNFYLAIALISFLILVGHCAVILLDWRIITPLIDLLLCGCLIIFWFISAVMLAVRVDQISQTVVVKEASLTFKSIEGSLAMAFCCMVFLVGSSWFALKSYNHLREFPSDQTQKHVVADLPQDIII